MIFAKSEYIIFSDKIIVLGEIFFGPAALLIFNSLIIVLICSAVGKRILHLFSALPTLLFMLMIHLPFYLTF